MTRGTPKDVRDAIEALGFSPASRYVQFSKGDRWYERRPGGAEVAWYLYLGYSAGLRCYSIRFSACSVALEARRPALHECLRPLFVPWHLDSFNLLEQPTWTYFYIANWLPNLGLGMPDGMDRVDLSPQLEAFRLTIVDTVLAKLRTAADVADFLWRDEGPHSWRMGNSVLRFVEYAAHAALAGVPAEELRRQAEETRARIVVSAYYKEPFPQFVDDLLRTLYP